MTTTIDLLTAAIDESADESLPVHERLGLLKAAAARARDELQRLDKPRNVDHLIDTVRQPTAAGEATGYYVAGRYHSDLEEARDNARRWSD